MSEGPSETPLPHRWPLVRIPAAVRMAFDVRKIALATIGLLLLRLGWSAIDPGALPDAIPEVGPPSYVGRAPTGPFGLGELILVRLGEPLRVLAAPMLAFFRPSSGWTTRAQALLALGWLVIVWGPIGLAIARLAAIQEARSRLGGIGEAFRFVRRSGPSMILAMIYPMAAIALFSVPGLAIGWLYRVPGGEAVAGVLLVVPLLCGLVIALLAASMLVGWAIFPAAIATGAEDALDAFSRAYSYWNQRPVMFVVGVASAAASGLVGLVAVDLLTWAVFRLSAWSLTLDGPPDRVLGFFGTDTGGAGSLAIAAHQSWLEGARLVAHAWIYSYFWTASTMVYLGLRREVDGTPNGAIDSPGPDA